MKYIIKSKDKNITIEIFDNPKDAIEYLEQRALSCYLEILK